MPRHAKGRQRVASLPGPTHSRSMRVSRITSLLIALAIAAAAALWLADLAHNDFGIPRHTIRADALLSALLVLGLLMIGLFSQRLGDRR